MIIADLQIHSRFANACSRDITLDNLEKWAKIKGVNLMGTGDFQHPKWREEINQKLTEDDNGILRSKTGYPFLWQTEISLIYTQDGRGRRVHHLILAPNKNVADQITEALGKKGRLDYDGRPIFGFSSIELVEMMMSISPDIEIIPAHAWTSWFAIFGSKSGFDSVEECFKEKAKYIHAIETGMSSDPAMNRRISKLDKYQLVSNSDMHSYWPWRLGREATLFDCKMTYKDILKAIRTGKGLAGTIEVNPAYGKYHVDGHRTCNVHMNFEESRKLNKICPKCKREMTIGVEYRIEELADRPKSYVHKNGKPFHTLTPLHELIASIYNIHLLTSKKVWAIYNKGIEKFGSEYKISMEADLKSLNEVFHPKLSQLIIKDREGKTKVEPGYDGVYGKVVLDNSERLSEEGKAQKSLSEF